MNTIDPLDNVHVDPTKLDHKQKELAALKVHQAAFATSIANIEGTHPPKVVVGEKRSLAEIEARIAFLEAPQAQ